MSYANFFPMIDPAVLDMSPKLYRMKYGERYYVGPIRIGQVFAWRPELPRARELVIVTEITIPGDPDHEATAKTLQFRDSRVQFPPSMDDLIWTTALDRAHPDYGRGPFHNTEDNFRAAVQATIFKDMATEPQVLPLNSLELVMSGKDG